MPFGIGLDVVSSDSEVSALARGRRTGALTSLPLLALIAMRTGSAILVVEIVHLNVVDDLLRHQVTN